MSQIAMLQPKNLSGLFVAISAAVISACAPAALPENSCVGFSKTFKSIHVKLSDLGPDYLDKPLPASARKLEAGYDSRCKTGGLGDVYIQCFTGDDPTLHAVVRDAPVIWTDAEGFTVLVVSEEDYMRLQNQEFFWAKCEDGL